MSSDNFYVVGHHPLGGYAVEQFFASDEDSVITIEARRFSTLSDAMAYAKQQYSEYGICWSEAIEKELG